MALARPGAAHHRPGSPAHPARGGAADLAAPKEGLPAGSGQGGLRPRRQHDRGPAGDAGGDRKRGPGAPLDRQAGLERLRRAPRCAVVGGASRRVRPGRPPHGRDLCLRARLWLDRGQGFPGPERRHARGPGPRVHAGEGPLRGRLRGADLARLPPAQPVRRAGAHVGCGPLLVDLRPPAPRQSQRQRAGDGGDLCRRAAAGGGAPAHGTPLRRHRAAHRLEPLRGCGLRLPGERRPGAGEPDRDRAARTGGVDRRGLRSGGRPGGDHRVRGGDRAPLPASTLS